MPRVTVLITLYNKGAFVEEAVRSVLAQTFTDFELLVLDDASTDDGLERVKAIADPRIRVLESATNTGRPSAANRGYDAAGGEYVAVLDADDRMHPQRLEKQVAFMDARPEVGVVGSFARSFGAYDRLMGYGVTDEEIRGRMLFQIPVLYPSCMIRRSLLERFRVRCEPGWRIPGMDYLFLLEVGRHAQYANIPEPLTEYRTGEQNMKHGRDVIADRAALYERQFRFHGIRAMENDIRLQLLFQRLGRARATSRDVRDLHDWVRRLRLANRSAAAFPMAAFERELTKRWDRLFYYFADAGFGPGMAHLRLSGPSVARCIYLAKLVMRRSFNDLFRRS